MVRPAVIGTGQGWPVNYPKKIFPPYLDSKSVRISKPPHCGRSRSLWWYLPVQSFRRLFFASPGWDNRERLMLQRHLSRDQNSGFIVIYLVHIFPRQCALLLESYGMRLPELCNECRDSFGAGRTREKLTNKYEVRCRMSASIPIRLVGAE